jgi:hypothetical protein
MFRRFASATAVAAPAVGIATCVVLVVPRVPLERFAPVLALWCVVAGVWGVWAMLTPRSWVPQRLPVWGAILGALAATLAMFVLDLPSRMLSAPVSVGFRGLGVVALVLFYYLLWMLVRRAYRALTA